MAAVNVAWQTSQVIRFLFEDDEDVSSRLFHSELETDGPGDSEDTFDPVLIADRLRQIGDTLQEDAKFQVALTDLKKAAAQEVFEEVFSHSVKSVCESQVTQNAEVASELQLIQASVAFGLYVKKSSPELKCRVQRAITTFLNMHVGAWVAQQGGWDKVPGV